MELPAMTYIAVLNVNTTTNKHKFVVEIDLHLSKPTLLILLLIKKRDALSR